ncbi:MAG: hypothetical protein II830_02955 [Alphaproteobacteria bacterium]|nr:hypothetical protein [Alphaproteobacteria bacterium]
MAQKKEKMVVINGVAVPMSKAEGRLRALANGRRIKAEKDASLAATRRDEIEKMRKAGWSEDEIRQHFLTENAEVAASHGFIRPARSVRAGKRQWGPTMMIH